MDSWLFHFTPVTQLECWSPRLQLRHAAVALADRARAEYRSFVAVTPETDLSWDSFESFLHTQFGPKTPVRFYTRKLMSLRQGEHETVSGYSSRFRRTLLQLHMAQVSALPNLTVVTLYQEGLRSEFQVELERDQPSTLAEAIQSAEKAERIWKRERSPHPAPDGTAECFAVTRSQWKSNGSSGGQPQQPPTTALSSPSDHSTVLLQHLVTQHHNYWHNKVTLSSSFSHNSRLQYPPHPLLVVLSSLVLQLPGFVVNASSVITMDIASPSAAKV